jgi:hypothetical protein
MKYEVFRALFARLGLREIPKRHGDIASDLTKVECDAIMLLKSERLLLKSLLGPVAT